jgi:hypothetical protein
MRSSHSQYACLQVSRDNGGMGFIGVQVTYEFLLSLNSLYETHFYNDYQVFYPSMFFITVDQDQSRLL